MSSSLQLVVEQPLRFSTDAFQASDSGTAQSAVLLTDISLIDAGMTAQPATLMAVATDHAEGAGSERAARALESTIDAVKKTLKKGGTVSLVGFGTFAVGKRAARTGRNPRTGAAIKIKAAKVPKFRPGKALKDALN